MNFNGFINPYQNKFFHESAFMQHLLLSKGKRPETPLNVDHIAPNAPPREKSPLIERMQFFPLNPYKNPTPQWLMHGEMNPYNPRINSNYFESAYNQKQRVLELQRSKAKHRMQQSEVIVLSDDDQCQKNEVQKKEVSISKNAFKTVEANQPITFKGQELTYLQRKTKHIQKKDKFVNPEKLIRRKLKEKNNKKNKQQIVKQPPQISTERVFDQKQKQKYNAIKAQKSKESRIKISIGNYFQVSVPKLLSFDQHMTVWKEQKKKLLLERLGQ